MPLKENVSSALVPFEPNFDDQEVPDFDLVSLLNEVENSQDGNYKHRDDDIQQFNLHDVKPSKISLLQLNHSEHYVQYEKLNTLIFM